MIKDNLLKKYLLVPAVSAATLTLSACNSGTVYAPQSSDRTDNMNGYTSEQIMPNRYRVSFSGNEFTSREEVEKLLLYRAAELTQMQGYDGFEMVRDNTIKSNSIDVDTVPATGAIATYPGFSPYYNFYGPSYGTYAYDPYYGYPIQNERVVISQSERFDATAVIKMYEGNAPAASKQSFDASAVISRIGPVEGI